MADSPYEKGITELLKMKVADLKAELKGRGLPTTGNKNDLVERLQLALHGDSTLSLDENTEEILDEDAVLGDEEIEEISSKAETPEPPAKRKLSIESTDETTANSNVATTDASAAAAAKKIVLNRNPVIEEIKIDTAAEKKEEKETSEQESGEPERKIIKLSEFGVKERLEMRAKKFGVPLSEAAKKEARLARFSLNNQNKSAASVKIPVHTTYEVLKKRAERFGTSNSTLLEKAELEARIEKRKARFGDVKPVEKIFPNNKIKIVK